MLNILGLILGIFCFLLTLLFVFYENSFDGYHENKDRLARIVTTLNSGGNVTNTALANGFLANSLPDEFPEIETMIRFKRLENKNILKADGISEGIITENVFLVDPLVFRVFSYELLEGNPTTCLAEPNSIVITENTGRKLFGTAAELNKIVILNGRTFKVTGIAKDLVGNSDLKFDALIPVLAIEQIDWAYSYLLFNNSDSRDNFQPKLDEYTEEYIKPLVSKEGVQINYTLEPLEETHFSKNLVYDTKKGNKTYVYIFLATGILILFIACINYINLTVVKSYVRLSEISVQKIFGASQWSIVVQFIIESFILVIVATIISFLLVLALVPTYADVLNKGMTVASLFDWRIVTTLFFVIVLLSISGSIYMGFAAKNLQLSSVLKSKGGGQSHQIKKVAKGMLGLQFFISFFMIMSGLMVYQQVKFLNDAPLGFDYENVMVLELPQNDEKTAQAKQLKILLNRQPQVIHTALCGENSLPGQSPSIEVFQYQHNGAQNRKTSNNISIDEDYFDLLNVSLSKGNHFREKESGDTVVHAMVSKMFVKNAGWKDPIGKKITVLGERELEVVGVAADFHFASLHNPMEPLIIIQDNAFPAYLLIKTDKGGVELSTTVLASLWSQAYAEYPLNYFYLDEYLSRQYQDERSLVLLLFSLTGLIIFISCLGLIAYCSYVIKQDSLEIAVKLILGASFVNILEKFVRQFLPLLLLAFVISSVVAWYFLDEWLNQFSYHIELDFRYFLLALLSMVILVGTIVFVYTLKGFRTNPIELIREN